MEQSLEHPEAQALGERCAKLVAGRKLGGWHLLGCADSFGCLRSEVHYQRLGDALEAPSRRDAVDLSLRPLPVSDPAAMSVAYARPSIRPRTG